MLQVFAITSKYKLLIAYQNEIARVQPFAVNPFPLTVYVLVFDKCAVPRRGVRYFATATRVHPQQAMASRNAVGIDYDVALWSAAE